MNETMGVVSINVTLIWMMVNFVVLIYIFNRFLIKPVGKLLEERREKVKSDLENAESSKNEAMQFKKQAETDIKGAKIKAQDTITEAIRKADVMKDEILKDAHATREKMIAAAETDIVKIKEQVKKELRSEMTEIAIKLAEKMITEKMNSKVEENLLDEFIGKVGENQ